MRSKNLLIIDDELSVRNLLSKLLTLEGFRTAATDNIESGMKTLTDEEVHVLILDVRLGEKVSTEYIPKIKKISPFTEIIMLTAYGNIADGVNAIKLGAFDYIRKGDDDDKIVPAADKAFEKNQMSLRLAKLEERIKSGYGFDKVLGSSAKIKEAVSLAKKISRSDTAVLLIGETGTGKEVFARSIHYESTRSNKPFVAVNCSALPKEIMESELFGYKKGAFTGADSNKKGLFEEADGGSIFLDEIAEMDYGLQAKLLRVLESNSFIKPGDTTETVVDVRIISATNRNIRLAIEKDEFRKDLYYRIGVFVIDLPALKGRKEDIEILARNFIEEFAMKMNKNIPEIEKEFLSRLLDYSFPGNIRELRNICERAVILADEGLIRAEFLPPEYYNQPPSTQHTSQDLSIASAEKLQIMKVLKMFSNDKNKAAETLGIGLTTLYRKIAQYGIEE